MTTYRRRPPEYTLVRQNGDGTVTLRDIVTGETVNVKREIFEAAYDEVFVPPPGNPATDVRGRRA